MFENIPVIVVSVATAFCVADTAFMIGHQEHTEKMPDAGNQLGLVASLERMKIANYVEKKDTNKMLVSVGAGLIAIALPETNSFLECIGEVAITGCAAGFISYFNGAAI